MRRFTRLAAVAGVLIGLGQVGATAALAQAPMTEVTFGLHPQNNSNLHGTVTLVPMGTQTKVTIQLTMMDGHPVMGMAPMPAHIHQGTCANLNPAPLYPLNSVVDGHSETVVNASFEANAGRELAVNVHKSAQEVSTYVACGDLNRANAMAMPGGAMMPAPGAMMPAPGQAMPSQQGQMAQGAMMPAQGQAMTGGQGQMMAGAPGQMTQMPKGVMAGGAMMPTTMPRTGDVPLAPVALLGLGAVAAGAAIRRRDR